MQSFKMDRLTQSAHAGSAAAAIAGNDEIWARLPSADGHHQRDALRRQPQALHRAMVSERLEVDDVCAGRQRGTGRFISLVWFDLLVQSRHGRAG